MISVPGIGSGLDISSLVGQLVAAEGNNKTVLLSGQKSNAQAQISAFGGIKSALSSLQSTLDSLKTDDGFFARKATSEDTDFFTVSAGENAALGSYDIEVVKLAEAHKLSSIGFASEDSVVGTGTLTIAVGTTSFDITIDSSNNTVSQIADAINDSTSNSGVSATTINVDDGIGGTETRLVLSANDTGTANELTVTVTDDDANDIDLSGLSVLVYDPAGSGTTNSSEITAAVDAEIKIDGQTATRSSNTISDAISDITIELFQVEITGGDTHKLTVTEDSPAIIDKVSDFVSKYNGLNSTINEFSAYDAETGTASILLGDFTLRGIETQVRRLLYDEVTGLNGTIRTLVDLGVTTNDDGSLSFDSAVLSDALAAEPTGVAEFFNSDQGFATRLDDLLSGYVGVNGLLDSKTDGLNARVTDIDDDLEALELRLQTMEERLLAQFSALDGLLAQLQATSSFLTQSLATISINNNNN